MLAKQMIPCGSREAIVTVLSYESGNMNGYLQHPAQKNAKKINSLSELILEINHLLDIEDSPNGSQIPLVYPECEISNEKAVFRIDVLFRDHCTWQGRLIWETKKQEATFRSGIELMQLLDEILEEG